MYVTLVDFLLSRDWRWRSVNALSAVLLPMGFDGHAHALLRWRPLQQLKAIYNFKCSLPLEYFYSWSSTFFVNNKGAYERQEATKATYKVSVDSKNYEIIWLIPSRLPRTLSCPCPMGGSRAPSNDNSAVFMSPLPLHYDVWLVGGPTELKKHWLIVRETG